MYLSEPDKQSIIEICKRNNISYCAVFGSFARGDATEESDLDLLVKFSKPKGWDWIDGALEIEDKLGRKVDWVTKDALSKYTEDDEFGTVRLCESINGFASGEPRDLIAHCLEHVRNFRGMAERRDDLSMLALSFV